MYKENYKLLIADDEYWTREKFRNIIKWQDYGIEFLEPVENGQEVLDVLERERVDILITDINMPLVNGVELISLVKKKYPDVVMFVVSGYDDFEYVKSSLISGAINYLLKPVSKMDLVSAISKALEWISVQEKNKIQTLKMSSLLQDREYSMLVEKKEMSFASNINLDESLDRAGCSLLLIKIHNLKELMEKYQYDMNLLSYSIKKKIKELNCHKDLLVFNYIYRSNEFILLSDLDNAELDKMALKIENYFRGETTSPITITISEHLYSIESIHSAYIQSVSLLMLRKYKKESVIISDKRVKQSITNQTVNAPLTKEVEAQLKLLLKAGNKDALQRMVFDTIGIRKCEKEQWSYLAVRQTVKRICNILSDHMMEKQHSKEIFDLAGLVEVADKTIELLDNRELCNVMEEILVLVSDSKKEKLSGSMKEVVGQAIGYIDSNYFESLSLTSLAKQFGVESSYFSKLFRQVTGDNLMSYIAKKRIERAKDYMHNEDMNLAEIAFSVGYDDYTYFNKVFRKMEGISPKTYRSQL
ncbi:two-component response regulator yesN [Lachnospiraceae bacterium KM106-2]|nr:two-component response regulator yesN [Lachnospiraceae bacterium KM106-2]